MTTDPTTGARETLPSIRVHDAAAAVDFYQRAFGAEQLAQAVTADGTVLHSRLRIGDLVLMVSAEWPEARSPEVLGQTGTCLELRVRDVAGVVQRAVRAGTHRLGGESEAARLLDPFGQRWSLWCEDERIEEGLAALASVAGR